jgi:photosystem II stability/assembly factor-like uncharacterized protein
MKKLLLFIVFLTTVLGYSQDFWTEYSTGYYDTGSYGVRSISIVDQNTTWLTMNGDVAGQEMRLYSKTVDGGVSWTPGFVDFGLNSSKYGLANIHGISSLVAYAAVCPNAADVQGGIWKTEDGGINWSRQASASFSDVNSFTSMVYFWNTNEGVAMGDAANGYFEIYITSNGGNLWTRLASTPEIVPVNSDEYLLINKFEVYGNTIWVGTTSGRILKSSDKGLTWTVSQSPISSFGGYLLGDYMYGNLAFTDLSNGLLQTKDKRLYKTVDGGLTWTEIFYSGFLRDFNIGAVPGMTDTYITVGMQDFPIVDERGSSYSIDGGYTWTSINNNPDTNFVNGAAIEMLDADHGFAGGFTTSPSVGGVFKWGGGAMLRQAQLAVSTFSDDKAVTVFPNPTSEVLNITAKKIKQIEVIDLLGKQIGTTKYNSLDAVNLNLDFLTSGVYMLRVTNDEGVFVSKVIKE